MGSASFDLYFLRRPENDDWFTAMETLDDNAGAERASTPADIELWSRVEARVLAVLPEAEVSAGGSFRELTEPTLGLQLFLSPGEIAVSVPYWYEGDEADQVVALLRQVAEAIEAETGLTAYDPQDDRAFLESDSEAGRVFDQVAEQVGHHLQAHDAAPTPPPDERPQSWLQRVFGRRRR